jgi:hypothetical protein
LVTVRDRCVIITQIIIDSSSVNIASIKPGIELDGLVIIRDRSVKTTNLMVDGSSIDVGFEETRVERERLMIIRNCGLRVTPLSMSNSSLMVSQCRGRYCNGLVEVKDRAFIVSSVYQSYPFIDKCLSLRWRKRVITHSLCTLKVDVNERSNSLSVEFPNLVLNQLGIDKLRAIAPALDLGNNLTLESLVITLEQTQAAIAQYNAMSAELEKSSRLMQVQEKQLAALLKRTVLGVGAKFGDKSEEYSAIRKLWKLTRRRKPTGAETEVAPVSPATPEAAGA